MRPISALLPLLAAAPALAEPIPPSVERMIDAVAGNPDQLKLIGDIAARANPASASEIAEKVKTITAAQTRAREEKLAQQTLLQGWSGQGEAGGFVSSGNTENRGVAIGVNLGKETRRWKHSLRGQVDYQEDQGVTSRERFFAGYEGNWKFSPHGFLVLGVSYERDRFTGFNSRFTQSIGGGYKLLDGPRLSLAVDAGPALRQTRFTNGVSENTLAARAGANGRWVIGPSLTLTETASYYADNINSSLLSLTQLTAKLNGRLSARLSLQVNNESDPPAGRENTDTVTRATLVYNF